MKRMIFVIAFSVIASPLFAQNTLTMHGTKNVLSPFDIVIDTLECQIPIVSNPANPPQVVSVESGFKISWCIDAAPIVAARTTYTMMVDGAGPFILTPSCTSWGPPTTCLSLIPIAAITALQVKTFHTLIISGHDEQTNTTSPPLQITIRRPVCDTMGVTYEVDDPLPVIVTGALRNQQGSFTFESQVGLLRKQGWKIEWQRVQFGLDSNGLNGYWYMLGWCVGK